MVENLRPCVEYELQEMMSLAPVTNFIIGQKIQWVGHILRGKENDIL